MPVVVCGAVARLHVFELWPVYSRGPVQPLSTVFAVLRFQGWLHIFHDAPHPR
eukprot:CAMPEP_0171242296 /NCGR_PEP_ID=MMETSP0790-20130122/45604_1 /TAXON_ID=2925 /ORGANISM="Alexandrium catenella, Strain OF101" /LENGTH=52 /DNA_ID=CAMNT_0011709065 /DNA_START=77 /DNA_END=232 /DNA_ORIENTATION=+